MTFRIEFIGTSAEISVSDVHQHVCEFSQVDTHVTTVVQEHAACCQQELTVVKGQEVIVLERSPSNPDWCLVRGSDSSGSLSEGLVPMSSLRVTSSLKGSASWNSMEGAEIGELY